MREVKEQMFKKAFLTLMSLFIATMIYGEGRADQRETRVKDRRSSLERSEAWVLMEASTGAILMEKELHKPRPLASVTKMMLIYIVSEGLKNGTLHLDDQIKVSRWASQIGGQQVYLKEGEVFSLGDMMKAICISSANDACVAVAEHVAGDAFAFVDLMNEKAKELKMEHTTYYSVHGLPPSKDNEGEKDRSCAYDQALLARHLVDNKQVLQWTSTIEDTFRDGTFSLTNTNKLLRTFRGMDGLKTGHYANAGYNLVGTAKRGRLRFIAVLLGGETSSVRFHGVASLLSKGYRDYTMTLVAKGGLPFGDEIELSYGKVKAIRLVPEEDIVLLTKKGKEKAFKVTFEGPKKLTAPLKKDQEVGNFLVQSEEGFEQRVKAIVPQDVPKATLLERIRLWFEL